MNLSHFMSQHQSSNPSNKKFQYIFFSISFLLSHRIFSLYLALYFYFLKLRCVKLNCPIEKHHLTSRKILGQHIDKVFMQVVRKLHKLFIISCGSPCAMLAQFLGWFSLIKNNYWFIFTSHVMYNIIHYSCKYTHVQICLIYHVNLI